MSKKQEKPTYSYTYKPRVNAALLKSNVGNEVILVGFVQKVDNNSVIIEASDKVQVKVSIKNSDVSTSSLVEAIGKVNQDGSITATECYLLPEDKDKEFNLENYNKMVVLINTKCRVPFMSV